MTSVTPEQIDELLPQTQCGLCGYNGCQPYAKAIAEQGEQINRCLPGGVTTLMALGQLLAVTPEPFIAEMQQKTKPPLLAVIREDECIGCTKCLQACPVDAIVGAAKQLHTVIAVECSGCELCVAPCPVDCIEMQPITPWDENTRKQKAQQFRRRFAARQTRLVQEKIRQRLQYQHAKLPQPAPQGQTLAQRQAAIAAAVARVKAKKSQQAITPENKSYERP